MAAASPFGVASEVNLAMGEQVRVDQNEAIGPGVVTTDDVGLYSIANTILLDSRLTMAYAAGINDSNPAYFNDLSPDGSSMRASTAMRHGSRDFAGSYAAWW